MVSFDAGHDDEKKSDFLDEIKRLENVLMKNLDEEVFKLKRSNSHYDASSEIFNRSQASGCSSLQNELNKVVLVEENSFQCKGQLQGGNVDIDESLQHPSAIKREMSWAIEEHENASEIFQSHVKESREMLQSLEEQLNQSTTDVSDMHSNIETLQTMLNDLESRFDQKTSSEAGASIAASSGVHSTSSFRSRNSRRSNPSDCYLSLDAIENHNRLQNVRNQLYHDDSMSAFSVNARASEEVEKYIHDPDFLRQEEQNNKETIPSLHAYGYYSSVPNDYYNAYKKLDVASPENTRPRRDKTNEIPQTSCAAFTMAKLLNVFHRMEVCVANCNTDDVLNGTYQRQFTHQTTRCLTQLNGECNSACNSAGYNCYD